MSPDGNEILVVDDECALTQYLERELSALGYRVYVANDGREALDTVKSTPIVLIILDLKMPGVDGFEVLKIVKENYPHIKIVVLTGHADLANAIKCKKLGADQFLEKPYNLSELSNEVHRLISPRQDISLT